MLNLNTADPTAIFFSVIFILVLVGLVISVHEAAHAFVANYFGDPTARLMGRISLNPLVHIDPIGTIFLPFILLILGYPIFGWARPTPVNPINFRRPLRDSALVALAGPASNLLLASLFSVAFRLTPNEFFLNIVVLNLLLAVFNLVPLPPLDGYKVLLGVLPKNLAIRLATLEAYGSLVLLPLLLVFLIIFSKIIFLVVAAAALILTGVSL